MPGLGAKGAAAVVPLLALSFLPTVPTLRTTPPASARATATVTPAVGRSLALVPASVLNAMTGTAGVRPAAPVRIGLVLSAPRLAALRMYARAVATPSSPLYHRFLTARAVARRFGPARAVVAADRAALARLGFSRIRRQGFILYATARAADVAHALDVKLRRARYHSATLIVPDGPVRLPATLSDVAWVTGLVRPVAGPAPASRGARGATARTLPVAARATVAVLPAAASLDGGYSVSSAVVGPADVPTGLPVTIRTTVITPSGTGDASARLASYAIEAAPPGQGASGVEVEGPDASGQLASTFTAYAAGTYQLSATLVPAPGQPPQTVLLPAVTFTGDTAVQGPLSAAQMNAALGATAVVAQSASHRPAIAVFATTAPDAADLAAFAQDNAVAPLDVRVVPVDGGPSAKTNDGGELSLDLEGLDTTSPGATVEVYAVPQTYVGDTFLDVMNAVAAADDVSVLSMSYDQPEMGGGDEAALEQAVAALNAEGITVVDGSGDSGAYGTGAPSGTTIASPADTPAVTAVGGVDMRVDAQGAGLATSFWGGEEYAALDPSFLASVLAQSGGAGNVLGGGGYSRYFPAPSWQAALVAAAPGGGSGGRGLPDLAMPASPDFAGLAMTLQGQTMSGGGTSLATPLFAGYLADIAAETGSRFGDVNPDLYRAAAMDPALMTQALYGYDGAWSIGPGVWNPLTGLGTPNIARLAQDLGTISAGAVQAVAAKPSTPEAVVPGQAVTAVFTATTADGSAAAGALLTFSVTGTLPVTGLSATAATTDAAGQASVTFQDPSGPASGAIVATAVGGARAQTATLTVAAPVPTSLAFANPRVRALAGETSRLAVVAATAAGTPVQTPFGVIVQVAGPRRRLLRTTLAPGGSVPLRLVKAGAYTVTLSLAGNPAVRARAFLAVVPGAAARYALRQPAAARPATTFQSRLTAYDAFGNVDTVLSGTVRWTWILAGRTFRAATRFRGGVAKASFRVPGHVRGRVRTTYVVR